MGFLLEDNVCRRCGGRRYFPQFSHIEGGRCFRCRGVGRRRTAIGKVVHVAYWILAIIIAIYLAAGRSRQFVVTVVILVVVLASARLLQSWLYGIYIQHLDSKSLNANEANRSGTYLVNSGDGTYGSLEVIRRQQERAVEGARKKPEEKQIRQDRIIAPGVGFRDIANYCKLYGVSVSVDDGKKEIWVDMDESGFQALREHLQQWGFKYRAGKGWCRDLPE